MGKKTNEELVSAYIGASKRHMRPTIIYEDTTDSYGNIKRVPKVVLRDLSKPYTPQEGQETLIGNIAAMVKTNVQVVHKPEYLSKALSGNPFDLVRLGRSVISSMNAAEADYIKNNNNSKDNDQYETH